MRCTSPPPADAESPGSARSPCARSRSWSAIANAADSPPGSPRSAAPPAPPPPCRELSPPPHIRAQTSSSSNSATASAADSPASLPHKAGQETHEFPAALAKDDRYSAHIRNPPDVPTSTLRSQCHPPKRSVGSSYFKSPALAQRANFS